MLLRCAHIYMRVAIQIHSCGGSERQNVCLFLEDKLEQACCSLSHNTSAFTQQLGPSHNNKGLCSHAKGELISLICAAGERESRRTIRSEPHGLSLVKGNDRTAFQNIPFGRPPPLIGKRFQERLRAQARCYHWVSTGNGLSTVCLKSSDNDRDQLITASARRHIRLPHGASRAVTRGFTSFT